MVEPLRHRQTKGAATDMFYLTPPRHISTLQLKIILTTIADRLNKKKPTAYQGVRDPWEDRHKQEIHHESSPDSPAAERPMVVRQVDPEGAYV